ncbi:MAG: hypothetical protein HQM11_17875 [SAR324 cluster bacterium]|nr:hypothetical protein [SAR324 cluster bacterium]
MIPLMIFLFMLTTLGVYAYQQSIQHRLQTDALLDMNRVYQSLNNILTSALSEIQRMTVAQLREKPLNLTAEALHVEPGWEVRLPVPDASNRIVLQTSYTRPHSRLEFESLFLLTPCDLTRVSFLVMNRRKSGTTTTGDCQPHTVFLRTEDQDNAQPVMGDAEILWAGTELTVTVHGQKQGITLNRSVSLLISGNTRLFLKAPLSPHPLQITTTGNLEWIPQTQLSAGQKLLFFGIVEQNLLIYQTGTPRDVLQGYFLVKGEDCVKLDGNIRSLQWHGSLACYHEPDFGSVTPEWLNVSPSASVPDAFIRYFLQYRGTRIIML